MSNFKNLAVLAILAVSLFSNAIFCEAQVVFKQWNKNKDEVFKMAKEQDKFILLATGHNNCPHCQGISDILGANDNGQLDGPKDMEGPLKQFVDDNFITWFSDMRYGYSSDIMVYVEEILATNPLSLPLISVINPDEPDKNFAFTWGSTRVPLPDNSALTLDVERTVQNLLKVLAIDLLSVSNLKWYKEKEEVFSLAAEQNKFIFKLVGSGTSPNSHKVIKQLNEAPLKQLLENNYVLWYSAYEPETTIDIELLSEEEETVKTLPYISIIYPEAPDIELESAWGGYQDVETLEELLTTYTVSNEIVLTENRVTVLGNVLQISNQTGNEEINLFSLNGQSIASFHKNDHTVRIDASDFPKGILIIHSAAGWSAKVIIK